MRCLTAGLVVVASCAEGRRRTSSSKQHYHYCDLNASESETCVPAVTQQSLVSATVMRATRAWMKKEARRARERLPEMVSELESRDERVRAWSSEEVNSTSPVLYLFSGADLFTVASLFPKAPAYTLVAEFEAGSPSCLADARCAAEATECVKSWFYHVGRRKFEYSNTANMRQVFNEVGILPALLLSAELLGWTLVGAEDGGGSAYFRRKVEADLWRCVRLTYSKTFVRDRADLDGVLALAAGTRNTLQPSSLAACFKAGAHDVARRAWFAEAVLDAAETIVQDESGLDFRMARGAWRVEPYGWFENFVPDQRARYAAEAAALRDFYGSRNTRTIPFCFGYCGANAGRSTVMVLTKHHPPPQTTTTAKKKKRPVLCVLLAAQLAGLSWLESLLAAHADADFALAAPRSDYADPAAYVADLDRAWAAAKPDVKVVGFKLLWHQVARFQREAAAWLRDKGAFFVHVERRRAIIQYVAAVGDSQYVAAIGHTLQAGRLVLDPAATRAALLGRRAANRQLHAWAITWCDEGVHLYYEDLHHRTTFNLNATLKLLGLRWSQDLDVDRPPAVPECRDRILNYKRIVKDLVNLDIAPRLLRSRSRFRFRGADNTDAAGAAALENSILYPS